MKISKRIPLLIAVLVMISFGCSHYDEASKGDESGPEEESHNPGEDCMRCHHDNKNEASEKWWYVAGTVFDSQGNAVPEAGRVELWTGINATGTLLKTLTIDKLGNFYTEQIIDFKGGYFPVVISGADTFPMGYKLVGIDLSRSCNSCHGHNGNGKNTPVITLN